MRAALVAVAVLALAALGSTAAALPASAPATPAGTGAVNLGSDGQLLSVSVGNSGAPGDDTAAVDEGLRAVDMDWDGAPMGASAHGGLRGFHVHDDVVPAAGDAITRLGGVGGVPIYPYVGPDGIDVGYAIGPLHRQAGADPEPWPDHWYDLGWGVGYDGLSLPPAFEGSTDQMLHDQFDTYRLVCRNAQETWGVDLPGCAHGEALADALLPDVVFHSELQEANVDLVQAAQDAAMGSLVARGPPAFEGFAPPHGAPAEDAAASPTAIASGAGLAPASAAAGPAAPRTWPPSTALLASEVPVPLAASLPIVLAALALVAPILVLYRRILPSKALGHPVREAMVARVRAHPGIHESQLAREMGLRHTHVQYHLRVLEEAGLVETRRFGGLKCIFELGRHSPGEKALAMADHGRGRALLEAIEASPGIAQRDLARAVGMSESSAKWHLDRLVAAGVVRTERARGQKRAWAVPAVLPAQPATAPFSLAAPPAP